MEKREALIIIIALSLWGIFKSINDVRELRQIRNIEETIVKIYEVLAHEKGGSDDGIRSSQIR